MKLYPLFVQFSFYLDKDNCRKTSFNSVKKSYILWKYAQ